MKKSFAVISFIILIAGCKKKDTTDATIPLQTNYTNVAYGNDPAQVMDIYLPPNRSMTETRAIILIHGGGWTSGDKTDFVAYVDTLQRRLPDYAIFNINYRLANGGGNLFPAQENDVKAAVQFIYSKRNEYAISEKFALFGASAGAHLALLQAYKDTNTVRIKTVVDYFGPADMAAMYNNPATPGGEFFVSNVTGTTPLLDSTLYAESSPINFIKNNSTPTIIFHGDADAIVRREQSDSLFAKLDSAGVSAGYKIYAGQNHGFVNDTLSNSFNYVQAFLIDHMQ